jgi:DNA-binding CsgD family transcriptional regulator
MLDEIDYGLVLLDDGYRVLHVNHAARAELDGDHPLQLIGAELQTRSPRDAAALADALQSASRGLRSLMTLGQGQQRRSQRRTVNVAVVPLVAPTGGVARTTLLTMGKRHVCESLSLQWFARNCGLTAGETRVLEALSQGLQPREVAALHGVGLSTVRTQIGSIRTKTGAQSVRELVHRVAALPPMIGSLRH